MFVLDPLSSVPPGHNFWYPHLPPLTCSRLTTSHNSLASPPPPSRAFPPSRLRVPSRTHYRIIFLRLSLPRCDFSRDGSRNLNTNNINNNRRKTHDYAEEMSASDRLVDTVSVDQTTNSTYSVNQVLSGAFDARANFQVIYLG